MRTPTSVVGIDPKTNFIWVIRLKAPVLAYIVHIETRTTEGFGDYKPESYQVAVPLFPNEGQAEISPELRRGLRLASGDFKRTTSWPQFEDGQIVLNMRVPKMLNVVSSWGDFGVVDMSNPKAPRYAPIIPTLLDKPEAFEGIGRFDGGRWVYTDARKLDEATLAPFVANLSHGFLGLDAISVQQQALGVQDYVHLKTLVDLHRAGQKPKAHVDTPVTFSATVRWHVDIAYHGKPIASCVPMEAARHWYEKYMARDRGAVVLMETMYHIANDPTLHNRGLLIANAPVEAPKRDLLMEFV